MTAAPACTRVGLAGVYSYLTNVHVFSTHVYRQNYIGPYMVCASLTYVKEIDAMAITPCRDAWKGTMTDRERFNRQMHYRAGRPLLQHGVRLLGGELHASGRSSSRTASPTTTRPTSSSTSTASAASAGNVWMHPAFRAARSSRRPRRQADHHERRRAAGRGAQGRARHDPALHQGRPIVTPDDWKRCKEERFRRDDPARMHRRRGAQGARIPPTATTRWASTAAP